MLENNFIFKGNEDKDSLNSLINEEEDKDAFFMQHDKPFLTIKFCHYYYINYLNNFGDYIRLSK